MDKKFCIFDMDGTLVDSMGYWQRMERDYLARRGAKPGLRVEQPLLLRAEAGGESEEYQRIYHRG